ncbi:DUF4139 domain-containing protein [Aurantiacibacter hainanensis]|uniref:DUF4139 domain-containing protein n=1 Tax=Aurantiacibacter hainanensis TaxID=3076114 RepID=UPI0030C663E5
MAVPFRRHRERSEARRLCLLAMTLLGGLLGSSLPAAAQDRAVVEASEPESLAVTVYRDPNRRFGGAMNANWPRGFAMISETRTVTLPPGESRIRFEGVAEGMVAVSAIVTGLPGGTIEKNRNADLLGPAALVDGTLGNRVTITRTNPATGDAESEQAVVRTRADGGLVLQTQDGYEAVRCSGLPERLTFDEVPDGLSARPIFSIDTRDESGGTYTVTLSYLAWGFDWEASYVATMHEGRDSDDVRFDLTSWLTILNDNGQSFADAELMAVAGTLNIVSDLEQLASPPRARPLRITCYPIGSTAAGSPIPVYDDYEMDMMADQAIVVTGSRVARESMAMAPPPPPPPPPAPVVAGEEDLGDLKLYRVPVPVDVNAQGLKQVAFLREEGVEGELVYEGSCLPHMWGDTRTVPAGMVLETVNDADHGLGVALPTGSVTVFERGPGGELLVAEESLRDYASGQDVELQIGSSAQVFVGCNAPGGQDPRERGKAWTRMQAELSNANPFPVSVRLELGAPSQWRFRGVREQVRDGQRFVMVVVPPNGVRRLEWDVAPVIS